VTSTFTTAVLSGEGTSVSAHDPGPHSNEVSAMTLASLELTATPNVSSSGSWISSCTSRLCGVTVFRSTVWSAIGLRVGGAFPFGPAGVESPPHAVAAAAESNAATRIGNGSVRSFIALRLLPHEWSLS
jgi:hypothetical protein